MSNKPLVSVIVPTKNSAKFLDKCLNSIKNQTYKNVELIVVDNNSSDNTKDIALRYTDKFYIWGPERSAQVNYGVGRASGKYVYKVDSDFVLQPTVIEECVKKIEEGYDAVVVHNSPDSDISWVAKIRKFEVDMYKYNLDHSSARFLSKDLYEKLGGFNENITAGEDYDFQNRINRGGYKTGFIDAEAIHLGEPTSFWRHMIKYYKYAKNDFLNYAKDNPEYKRELGTFVLVYLKNWHKFVKNPLLGISFILYTCVKFFFGGAGIFVSWFQNKLGKMISLRKINVG